jgi:hypothetical protein
MNSLRPFILITPAYSYYALLLFPGCYDMCTYFVPILRVIIQLY